MKVDEEKYNNYLRYQQTVQWMASRLRSRERQKECLISYRTAKTLGIINMDENNVVGSINKPETSQRISESKVENITKIFPPPKRNGRYSRGRAKSDVHTFV